MDRAVAIGMFVGTIRILPLPDRWTEVLDILRSIQGPVLAQPGCVACDIYEEQGPEHAVLLLERFDSEEAFLAHLRSEMYGRILGALELSRGRPGIRFERVGTSEGIELIERHRLPVGAPNVKGDES